MKRARRLVLLLVCAGAGRRAVAQSRPEIVRGHVTDAAGAPLANVPVSITMAPDRVVFRATTDALGAYELHVASGTGDYLVHITKIGLVPFRKRVTRSGADSVFVVDAKLEPIPQRLAAVRIQATKPKPSRTPDPGTEPGAAQKMADSFSAALRPEQEGDLNAIAATMPGLTPTSGGFSVLGLDPSQNSTTLDGMAFPAGAFPRGTPVNVRVSTTAYDPSRGWFSGANTNVELRGGGIYSFRRAFATIDAPGLQYTDAVSSKLGQRFTNANASIGGSGPIDSNDRYFYSFGMQAGHKDAAITSLPTADADLLRHAGVAFDSVSRLLSILRSAGVPTTLGAVPASLTTDNVSLMARFDRSPFDWVKLAPSKTNVAATLFGTWSRSRPIGVSPVGTPATGGAASTGTAGVQMLYSTFLREDFLSTTRSALSLTRNSTAGYVNLPNAAVLVASTFADGTAGVTALQFGGNGLATGSTNRWTWETTHETQLYAQDKRSLHRIKLSGDVRLDGYDDDVAGNRLGTYFFNSLSDVAAGAPSSFSRELTAPRQTGAEWNAYAALGDLWRITPNLQLQYGARLEGNVFANRPAYNPAVEQAFGDRTDVAPDTWHASPRLGFTWVRGGAGNNGAITFNPMGQFNMGPTSYLRGGIGEFRQMIPATLLSDALVQTGLPGGRSDIACVGDAVPPPNWSTYGTDPSLIPQACVPGASGVLAQGAPSVRLFSPAYTAPHSWRSNLSYASQFRRLAYSIEGTASLNLNQPSFIDRNLQPLVQFSTGDEGRQVFASTAGIVPSSGGISAAASRLVPAFDHVIEVRSDDRSVSRQLIVTASPDLFEVSNWYVSGSYVLGDSRALSNGFTTSAFGSPVERSWARGPYDARHAFLLQGGVAGAGLSFGIFARLSSGLPFTPLIGSDVNGDGYLNDRAFVFDPAATADPKLAAATRTLIADSPARIRNCLLRSLGKPASAGGCEGPWTATMNAALTLTSDVLHLGNRISRVQIGFANPLAGLDQLLHGSNRLRGWGIAPVPDPVLYNVRGFDPQNLRYAYEVNPRFGNTAPALSIARAPFRATIDVSFNLSRDPGLQQLERYLRPGRSGHSGERLGAAELKRRYKRSVPDPYAEIIQESDSLLLAPDQATALRRVQATYRERMDSLWTALATDFAALGDTFDPAAALDRQESAIERGWEISRLDVHAQLPRILSRIQLSLLPGNAAQLLRADGPVRRGGRTLFP